MNSNSVWFGIIFLLLTWGFSGASLSLIVFVWFFISTYKKEKPKMFLCVLGLSIFIFCVVLVLAIAGHSKRANDIFSSYIETIFIFVILRMLMEMVMKRLKECAMTSFKVTRMPECPKAYEDSFSISEDSSSRHISWHGRQCE